jgi:hypothetical protein
MTGFGVTAAKCTQAQALDLALSCPVAPSADCTAEQSLPEATEQQLSGLNFRDIISKRWREEEHINVLELRALSMAVRWAVSFPSAFGSRVVILSDSAVASAAVRKGRSSAYSLLRQLRGLSAMVLACNLALLPRWIPSRFNPADAASRQ